MSSITSSVNTWLPSGYRVQIVSDFDMRVYGPNNETWLIREEGEGEGTFSNFVYRMLLAATTGEPKTKAALPTRPQDPPSGRY